MFLMKVSAFLATLDSITVEKCLIYEQNKRRSFLNINLFCCIKY